MALIAVSSLLCSRAITPRTKMIMLNTPHNPIGKVFTREELLGVAALVEEFNLIAMADEVVSLYSYHTASYPVI